MMVFDGINVRTAGRAAALLALALTPFVPGASAGARSPLLPPRYAVIIVLDGARPDYFNPAQMPNYRWLLQHGVEYSNAFVGQEIANTPPSHATIGTGVFPRRHGVMGFVWTDPRTHQMTRPADTPALLTGALEQVLAEHHVPSLAAAVKRADPRATVLAVSGHKCYAADAMGTPRADYILCSLIYRDRWVAQAIGRHRPPPGAINNPRWDVPIPSPTSGFAPAVEQWNLTEENSWTIRYALWAFNRIYYPRVMMINLPETDVTGHFALPNSSVEADLMKSFDRGLGQIISAYRHAGLLGRTVFVITSDHGMTRVRDRLTGSMLDDAIHAVGATKVYVEGDTGAVVGIREQSKSRALALEIANRGGRSIDATYYKTLSQGSWSYRLATAQRGLSRTLLSAYQTLADTQASDEGPDVMAVYAPHVTTGDRIVRDYHWLAGHLGPQWDEQHIPLLITGPGVRQGVVSNYPARLVDIAPTVERLLGLNGGKVDGIVLGDALSRETAEDSSRQQAVGRELTPLVKALQQRSG